MHGEHSIKSSKETPLALIPSQQMMMPVAYTLGKPEIPGIVEICP